MAQSTFSIVPNGSSGYVDYASLPVTAGPYTISCWAKTSNTGQNGTIVALSDGGVANSHVRVMVAATGVWRLNVIDSAGTQTQVDSGAISSGTWTHLLVTKGSGSSGYTFYVNGISQGTLTNATLNAFTIFNLGTLHFSSDLQFFDGQIDDLSVYSSVLGSTDITGLAAGTTNPNTLSPVLLSRLEEGTGSTTADTSGNGNGGTFHGTVTWSSDVPTQLQGGASDLGYPLHAIWRDQRQSKLQVIAY